ncbi:LLM class flavin-dependent oxidoreductase [Streptomyces pseudovenezuelae]|uniref:LLM class flavin-dependent oxidoreductase n=1 Tax=Streptomyces pseudovenezuelae TaxID=67350 RepID=UPI002E8041D3|nr:LLM class flavin-dependent oxidoreductase [Streptomyces pseudovenezuelae]WUA85896.1 LLM class flavin-dependent oxidoreductase [Streptomyces pseudovenezuelae]
MTAHSNDDKIRGITAGSAPVPLSVLDLAPVGSGRTAAHSLRTGVELARLGDRRGFHRYWVAEHHAMPDIASSSPAVVLAHLAAHTRRLRLGAGGVMLPNHAPLIVAEQFGTLEALAPDRIDLGVGRAGGTDAATAAALGRSDDAEDFPRRLGTLLHLLDDDVPEGHALAGVRAVPGRAQGLPSRPPVWILGASEGSAELAGRLGLPYAFAHHFFARRTVPALERYRECFRPSALLASPYALISVPVLAADNMGEARRQVRTGALAMIRRRLTGRSGPIPTPEEAEAHRFGAEDEELLRARLDVIVHGPGDEVRAGLDALQKSTGADELMITSTAHAGETRLRSYELLADAYGMPG